MPTVNVRDEELKFEDVVEKYPQIPRLLILKIDVQRRGVYYTQNVLDKIDPDVYQLIGSNVFFASLGARDPKTKSVPESLILRDGTIIITDPTPLDQNPYIMDYRDGKFVLVDRNEIVEEVDFWEKPDYYGKFTSSGTPMDSIVFARPQRLNITPTSYCYFWKNGNGCKYCDLVPHLKEDGVIKKKLTPQDAYETVREAIKQKGRFTNICMTMGSDFNGETPFDSEVDYYIEILQAIGENFKGRRFPSQVITTALNEKQLRRLYDETGLSSYTSDIEVLNEELFKWICPGKEEWVGYREWKRRLVAAVDIFGRGNVNSGIVGGVELAKPRGFKTEEDGLKRTLEEAEDLMSKGVSIVYIVWVPRPMSFFRNQKNASLEYYVKLTIGLNDLREKYKLRIDFDDYRRCGNHPNSDLLRIF
ncbi:radical SAM protein [Clostridium luticellarii]|jgi:hypothetical protein|uniref:radical SAM protein n=1 Tax=Clostridium luticellarii TaxID=1691940 RepID=UPI0023531A3D|nr:radical SAM protein [Clostridium luticellarii]MCI1946074.1 radical SAM protein [Clostridium luticellarii]MCI1967520.1 radical SAM protein [Clostridium luticellarii]